MRRLRMISRRCAVASGALIVALALTEVLLRASGRFQPNPPLYTGDREVTQRAWADTGVGWTMARSRTIDARVDGAAVRYGTNAFGTRGPHECEREPSKRTIAFVGDSFTFGVGVNDDQTFAALLERSLPGVRAVNLGVSGFGLDQMWRMLELRALPIEPEIVVVSFVLDDLDRCLRAYRERDGWTEKPTFVVEDGHLRPMTEADRPTFAWRWFEQHTALAELVRRVERKLAVSHGIGRRWELLEALCTAMRDACRANGAVLVFVHIPERDHWQRVPSLEALFESCDVPFLDLGACPHASPKELYFARDPHLDADGHRFVADALREFLERNALLRAPQSAERRDG